MASDAQRDKRYQRLYGITLIEYNQRLAEQKGGCGVCEKPPKPGRHLAVDHDHSIPRIKITTELNLVGNSVRLWEANFTFQGKNFRVFAPHKLEAVREAKFLLKRYSVRGLLCWRCNRLVLQKSNSNPEILEKAAAYLRRFNANK